MHEWVSGIVSIFLFIFLSKWKTDFNFEKVSKGIGLERSSRCFIIFFLQRKLFKKGDLCPAIKLFCTLIPNLCWSKLECFIMEKSFLPKSNFWEWEPNCLSGAPFVTPLSGYPSTFKNEMSGRVKRCSLFWSSVKVLKHRTNTPVSLSYCSHGFARSFLWPRHFGSYDISSNEFCPKT